MADSEALQVTLLVTRVLDDLGIPYVICGSMASIIHGMLRTTMDVDIVADMQPEHVSPFVDQLQDAFYADETVIHLAIKRHSSFNLIHRTAPRVLPASAGMGNRRNGGKRSVRLNRTNVLKSHA